MEENEIKKLSVQLMETTRPAYFTTVDSNGIPYTRAVENLRNRKQFPALIKMFADHQDDLTVYVSTNTSSTKVDQIRKNRAVSVYYCRPKEYLGVMLGGLIEIVTDHKLKEELWIDGWERYYPEGVGDPDFTVLRLFPKHIRGWNSGRTFMLDLE